MLRYCIFCCFFLFIGCGGDNKEAGKQKKTHRNKQTSNISKNQASPASDIFEIPEENVEKNAEAGKQKKTHRNKQTSNISENQVNPASDIFEIPEENVESSLTNKVSEQQKPPLNMETVPEDILMQLVLMSSKRSEEEVEIEKELMEQEESTLTEAEVPETSVENEQDSAEEGSTLNEAEAPKETTENEQETTEEGSTLNEAEAPKETTENEQETTEEGNTLNKAEASEETTENEQEEENTLNKAEATTEKKL